MSDSYRTKDLVPKVTCVARKTNGKPCSNRPIKGANVCKNHGGNAPAVRKKAAERILMAQDIAAAKLIELMQNPDVPYSIQRAAAADLLDRGGNVAAHVLAIPGLSSEPAPWEQIFAGIVGGSRAEYRAATGVASPEELADLEAGRTPPTNDIVDAEIVDEPPVCAGCGGRFPTNLPPWLNDYPEFCKACRAERGLADPGRTAVSAPGYPPGNLASPNAHEVAGVAGSTSGPAYLRARESASSPSQGKTLMTLEEAASIAAEANRRAGVLPRMSTGMRRR